MTLGLSCALPKDSSAPPLLLLREGEAHGYDLLQPVEAFGFDHSDPGGLYRTLRRLEREGLLEFLFSGSVFYANEAGGLQMTRITWESDADFALPVATWKEAMERHFPGAAWLRLDRESFDRLQAYTARHALLSWEATLASLLKGKEG